jgi:two-component system sensor histidine kinase UhpB
MRELDVIAAALRDLAQALDDASEQRRALSQKVLSLQEDERAHLARELHDEFGQRLTALRLDATWLQRQLALQAQASPSAEAPARLAEVVDAMAARCAEVQADIRSLLVRLRPLASAAGESTIAWTEVVDQLQSLVQAWRASAARGAADVDMRLLLQPGPAAPPLELRRDTALAVYRLSQEALTNVARHAHASRADIVLGWQDDASGRWLIWQARDDGIGITDPAQAQKRGNGLGGMQERVWALGGEWQAMGTLHSSVEASPNTKQAPEARPRPVGATGGTHARPGLTLGARLPLP